MTREFPYRVMPEPTADELQDLAQDIQRELAKIVNSVATVGQRLSVAEIQVCPELYEAWLFSVFGWKRSIADGFALAGLDYESRRDAFQPEAALEFARLQGARALCASELIKARNLIAAYRAILRGDITFTRWPNGTRPRKTVEGKQRRIRGRVYRSNLRRARPADNDEE